MEFKERCGHRWIMFWIGFVWLIALPAAYYVIFSQLIQQSLGIIMVVSAAMLILEFGAGISLKNGIVGLLVNGKKHLVLDDDGLQIIVNDGKNKGKVYDISYAEIYGFYFVYHRDSDKLNLKENAGGLINFYKGDPEDNIFHCVDVYNALQAAKFIIAKLRPDQIDEKENELDTNAN